jgi:hypothetical protein
VYLFSEIRANIPLYLKLKSIINVINIYGINIIVNNLRKKVIVFFDINLFCPKKYPIGTNNKTIRLWIEAKKRPKVKKLNLTDNKRETIYTPINKNGSLFFLKINASDFFTYSKSKYTRGVPSPSK